MLLFCATLFLAAFAPFVHLHPHCPKEKVHLLPLKLSEIQGRWHLISSAYQKEDRQKEDKQAVFSWMEIATVNDTTEMKHAVGLHGGLVILTNSNLTILEEDGCVTIKDHVHHMSSQLHKMSDDCIMWTVNNLTDTLHNIGDYMLCRSHIGNNADRKAFKTHAQCKNLDFMVERRSNFNYATDCESATHTMDPLDPKIEGRWHMVARASFYPTVMFEGRNPWLEFSVEGEKLKIQEGRMNFSFAETQVEVKGPNIALGKEKALHMRFYQNCEECLLLRTENDLKVVALHLMTRSGSYTDSQMETFLTSSRCLTLPALYKYDDVDLHKEEELYCKDDQHIEDPSAIAGKWLLVGKATADPDIIENEDDHWINLSWDGEKLKIEEGSRTHNRSVREVEVAGHKNVHNEANGYATFIPTCMDCLLMKIENTKKKVELLFLTRFANLTNSDIKTFAVNARCLHLPNVHIYEHTKPYVLDEPKCDTMLHILDVFVPDKVSGKWHLVGKAHSDSNRMEEEEDPWLEFSCDGQNLTIHEGRGKNSWPVKEVEVNGPRILIGKENSAHVTFHPTCEDCLLMKTQTSTVVILNMFTRSGKLTDSEIKKFKHNAHCVNLSNVLVYKSATPHKEKGHQNP
ncbi:hypothetical protein NDU88_000977 [Pleurodeles waltl]|uniref:Uncharacterized protein n=1 Tax=Pleurodeles waltl TaxID=8319 RepID=A0AAV7Q1T1_PLEWA|nr:hypothetical protein NDU88_000977 [Pleurodeles waltl]